MEVIFEVVAKSFGDSVAFFVKAETAKEALRLARLEAVNIFGEGAKFTVSLRPVNKE